MCIRDSNQLGRRARVMHELGRVQLKLSHYGEAEELFNQAYKTTLALSERNTSSPNMIFEHGQSAYWLGYTHWQLEDFDQAEFYFIKYRDLSLQLTEFDSNNIDWQRELAYAETNLGILFRRDTTRRQETSEIFLSLIHI